MRLFGVVLSLIFAFVSAAAAAEPKTLGWEDLLPEGEQERLDELYASQTMLPMFGHSGSDPMMQSVPRQIGTFNVVESLDGKLVRIPGFVVPFEYSAGGKISEFLLVPYFGACIHSPPPPPNQMVYVKADKPAALGDVWDAVWITGVLRTKQHINDLGDTAYTLELQSWEMYND